MIKLSIPNCTAEEAIDSCIRGIGTKKKKTKITTYKEILKDHELLYMDSAVNGKLYTIPSILEIDEKSLALVFGKLTKEELKRLYEYYMVTKEKPGRIIYNQIILAANEECPYCGGIGRPSTLDHFLPIAFYPQFSCLPQNLIPACGICNSGQKAANYARYEQDQIIHPYFDDDHFFDTQWVSARCSQNKLSTTPLVIEYFLEMPHDWNDCHKERARKHFKDFELAKRYSVEAGRRVGKILSQIKSAQEQGYSIEMIEKIIISPLIKSYNNNPNHWERIMCILLLNLLKKGRLPY